MVPGTVVAANRPFFSPLMPSAFKKRVSGLPAKPRARTSGPKGRARRVAAKVDVNRALQLPCRRIKGVDFAVNAGDEAGSCRPADRRQMSRNQPAQWPCPTGRASGPPVTRPAWSPLSSENGHRSHAHQFAVVWAECTRPARKPRRPCRLCPPRWKGTNPAGRE